MMTRPRCPRLVGPIVLTLAACLAPSVAAAQDAAFKDGMKAYDDRKWTDVVVAMRKAIQADGQDTRRRVDYGGLLGVRKKTVEYLPHFYLGEALYRVGDCTGAVEAWALAESQGAVKSNQDLVAIIQDGFAVCETTKSVLPPAKFDPLAQRATRRYSDVRTLAEGVSSLAAQNKEDFGPEVREQYERGRKELDAAREGLATASRSRSARDFDAVLAATDRAQAVFVAVQGALRSATEARQSAASLAREVEGVVSGAEALERQVDARVTSSRSVLSGSLASMRQRGHDSLSGARDRLAAGSPSANIQSLTEARSLGQDASRYYRQLLDELARQDEDAFAGQLQDAISGADQAFLLLDGLFTTLERRVAANPALADNGVTTEQLAIRKEADAARKRLASARATSNIASIAQARQMTLQASERLNKLLARFGPLSLREQGVSEALEEGARQFFVGAYDKALAALNAPAAVAPEDPLQLHVHLFRAASLYAQYSRSPKNGALLDEARAEVAACRQLNSAFEPDPRAFSPAFIMFFKTGNPGTRTPVTSSTAAARR